MSVRVLASAGALAAGVVLSLSSPALAVCDAYSGGCPSTPPGGGGGAPISGGDQDAGSGSGQAPGGGTGDPGTANPGGGTANPGGGTVTPSSSSNPSTLPFTGGEIALLTAIGAGALAGGTALVVAGRRRGSSPA